VVIIEIHGADDVRARFVEKLEAQHYDIVERTAEPGLACEVILAKRRD
jgi:hypothetical protein